MPQNSIYLFCMHFVFHLLPVHSLHARYFPCVFVAKECFVSESQESKWQQDHFPLPLACHDGASLLTRFTPPPFQPLPFHANDYYNMAI
jgi:hypothetical protein